MNLYLGNGLVAMIGLIGCTALTWVERADSRDDIHVPCQAPLPIYV